ncbi:MAG: hemin receptor [Ardenticatenales bacterium]|nr:hemin receptor [Ardenticatenales bacterium]
MNLAQIRLVRRTFEYIRPPSEASDVAVAMFYERLFELDPELRPLFKTDMAVQGRKLMQTLALMIDTLENPGAIALEVQALGLRHTGYGVQEQDYDTMREALLWTVRQSLGEAYLPEVEEAWTLAYNFLADVMKAAG